MWTIFWAGLKRLGWLFEYQVAARLLPHYVVTLKHRKPSVRLTLGYPNCLGYVGNLQSQAETCGLVVGHLQY
jgi:hypothetical protein